MSSPISFSLVSSSLLLVLIIFHPHAVVHCDTLEDNCKKLAGPNLSYDFCLKTLGADPNSKTADLQGLGIISAQLAIDSELAIRTHIQILKGQGGDNKLQQALSTCSSLYSDADEDAQEVLSDFKTNQYKDANVKLSALFDTPTTCEDQFKELGVAFPLTQENSEFQQTIAIALHITGLLQ